MFASEWISAEEFRSRLGIGRTTQWTLMREGVLKPVVHYYRISSGKRAPLKFNLPACEMALMILTQG